MKVTVIGAGVMGPGIAHVFLAAGHQVALTDISADALTRAGDDIETSWGLMRQMGIGPDAPLPATALTTTIDLADAVAGAALVVEAIPERLDLKQALYAELDQLCHPDTVIVSNTSAFPLPDMMPAFRPTNFFVAHFFNPPAIIPLVELVHNDRTDPHKVAWLRQILEDAGKTPIVLNRFVDGFLINRLQTALAREGLYLLEQGVVSAADLNTATMVGIGFKTAWQGLFDTMDYIGLDTCAFVYKLLYPQLCDATEVPQLVSDKVSHGDLGVKTGQGFFKYDDSGAAEEARQRVLLEQLKLYQRYASLTQGQRPA